MTKFRTGPEQHVWTSVFRGTLDLEVSIAGPVQKESIQKWQVNPSVWTVKASWFQTQNEPNVFSRSAQKSLIGVPMTDLVARVMSVDGVPAGIVTNVSVKQIWATAVAERSAVKGPLVSHATAGNCVYKSVRHTGENVGPGLVVKVLYAATALPLEAIVASVKPNGTYARTEKAVVLA